MDHRHTTLGGLREELARSRRSVWARTVLATTDENPGRLLALQALVGPRPDGWQDRLWEYEECTFVSGRMTGQRLAHWCAGGEQTFELGEVRTTIEFTENTGYTRMHVPSLAQYSNVQLDWPSYRHTPGLADQSHFNAPQSYLVGAGSTPSFPTFGGAYNAFFHDDYAISGVPNSPQLNVSINIVDNRARIRRVRIQPAAIDVRLGGNKVRGAYLELNGTEYRTVVQVEKPRVVIPLPDGLPADAWIWLKSGREWLDFRALNQWGGTISPDIEIDLPRDPAAELSNLATQGEGQFLEYKEKLPDTQDEKRKVFKTVVAFANGGGGTLVFGIEDETKAVKGLPGRASVERRRLTDMVRDLIIPSPTVSVDAGDVDGRHLLVLHVRPVPGTVYALVLDRNKPEYYLRRDGTTFYARPDELEAVARAAARPGNSPIRPR